MVTRTSLDVKCMRGRHVHYLAFVVDFFIRNVVLAADTM